MNVPALRFKEFNEEWFLKRLGDVAEKIGDGLHSTPIYDEKGQYFFINGNNLTNNKIEINENTKRLNVDEYLKHKIQLTTQTILISINGTIGNLAFFNNEKVVLGKSACYINLKENENKYFIFNLFKTSYITSHFNKELTGSTIRNLSLTTIKNTKAFFPSIEEQTKIANFLTAVDEKISLQTQKQNLLTQYKKGVMQQIFSQELRFKDDDGGEFPDWEEKTLDEVCVCLDNKRKPLNDAERQTMQGEIPYWGANNIMDYVNDYIYDETIVLLAEDGGNFNEYKTRPIANISHGKCWVNNHTHVLKGKAGLSNEFLFYSLVHKNITGYVSGGTRAKLTKGEMLKILIDMPSSKEQTKIANFLTAIDDKITATQTQLQAVKQYKQGLLQQMFV